MQGRLATVDGWRADLLRGHLVWILPTVDRFHVISGKAPGFAEALWRALLPVSYTHLDVYKRQVVNSAGKGKAQKQLPPPVAIRI